MNMLTAKLRLIVLLTILFVLAVPAHLLAAHPSLTANPKATADAKAIMRYLRSLPARHDKKVISGQFESWGTDVKPLSDSRNYVTIIHENTGKWVGLVGVIYAAAKGVLYTEQPNDLCKEFWRKGGLVQVFAIFDNPANPESHGNGKCNIQLVLNRNHAYHRSFFRQLDGVATALEKLQDEGVVVFLNIFPEMSGSWFWWGGQNPELFKELYRTTFDYLVKKRRLNNLLFVFEPSCACPKGVAYYPGDRYVDMVGISTYVDWNQELTPAQIPEYQMLCRLGKPMALSEWGPRRGREQLGKDQPPADNLKLMRAVQQNFPQIVWWMNWSVAYAISTQENSNYHERELLEHPWVVNLDDLAWRSAGH